MGALKSIIGRTFGIDRNTGQIIRDNTSHNGTPNGSTVTAKEYGDDIWHKTVLTLTATPITISDDAAVAQYGGVKVYDFPEGLIVIKAAMVTGNLTGGVTGTIINTFDGDVALGTVTASTGATLVSTEANIMISNAISQAVAKVAAVAGVSSATQVTESASAWLDGTATAIDCYLNFVIDDDATHTAGTAAFTGTITILWAYIGDN